MKFYSKIFVACPALSDGNYKWLGDLEGKSNKGDEETIHVIALNCENKDKIEGFLEKTIKEIETLEVKSMELEQKLLNLREYLNDIRCGVFEHSVPLLLMAAAVQQIRDTYGNEIANQLSSEKFMYLSSVDIRTVGQ